MSIHTDIPAGAALTQCTTNDDATTMSRAMSIEARPELGAGIAFTIITLLRRRMRPCCCGMDRRRLLSELVVVVVVVPVMSVMSLTVMAYDVTVCVSGVTRLGSGH